MNQETRDSILKLYEQEDVAVSGTGDFLFKIAVVLSFGLFGLGGYYLHTHNPPAQVMEERAVKLRKVTFVMEEKKKPATVVRATVPKPEIKKIEETVKQEPIDLTKNPQLAQKIDDVAPEPAPEPAAEPVRRVYGLRKVYATGLGAGGLAADAVIGKQGNTLNAPIDTVVATREDLKGRLVPITTVTTAPVLKKFVKPEYTVEMVEAKIEGAIKVEILINTEGKIVEIKFLNDLGYGTKDRAREALLQWLFEPAKKGSEPVAVWITYSIRFMLLDE